VGGLMRWIKPATWLVLIASTMLTALFAFRWQQTISINRKIEANGAQTLPPSSDPLVRYAAGWQAERMLHYPDAVQMYTDAQGSGDGLQDARTWFALGNAYFKTGIAASREYETKIGPLFENAQFDLAREAYRSALRIDPGLNDARYNLGLLERLAPVRHLQGFRRNTDPIMLVPDKHNGWTSMQDDNKRGLP
jgi:tetratricopeptide (TPR) repeat protein